MTQLQKSLFTDDEVASQVLRIIKDAKKHVVIVSPYVREMILWGNAVDAINVAMKKGVKITAFVRDEPNVLETPDVAALVSGGVHVFAIQRLHAKIYMNEKDVLVSSMNFMRASMQNSKEVALLIKDEEVEQEIRRYVENTLVSLSRPINSTAPTLTPQTPTYAPSTVPVVGHCIRCQMVVSINPLRPLCENCYSVWAGYGDEDYEENYCHTCGNPAPTSYAKPLCTSCYHKYR